MPGGPCSRREPSTTDISRVGLPSMPRMKSPVRKPGQRGRRAFPRRDDAQVVLTGQLEADVALRRRPCAGEGGDLGGREIRAVGIEPFCQAVHGPLHDAVAVDRFDVAAEDERHHFLEDAHRPVGLVARRGCLAHEPAGHDQQHDRRGDEQQDETGSRAHSLVVSLPRLAGRTTHDEHLPGRGSRTSTGADRRAGGPEHGSRCVRSLYIGIRAAMFLHAEPLPSWTSIANEWHNHAVRIVGVDLGLKRVGLAISDPSGTLARPLRTIERGASDTAAAAVLAEAIAALAADEDGVETDCGRPAEAARRIRHRADAARPPYGRPAPRRRRGADGAAGRTPQQSRGGQPAGTHRA